MIMKLPEITSVSNITQNVDVDSCSATVEYELPTATDNCEGVEVTLTEGLASGVISHWEKLSDLHCNRCYRK